MGRERGLAGFGEYLEIKIVAEALSGSLPEGDP
jgi:hypothetical protein